MSVLGFFTFTAFDLPATLDLEPLGATKKDAPRELSLLTWNIGYAGLDRDADYFMDELGFAHSDHQPVMARISIRE